MLYSYVVARDFGFAPNPFGEFCTLATCKPKIRQHAVLGDWVVGTGTAARGRRNYLVYAMKVTDALAFDQYWLDPRFEDKKPNLRASKKAAFGDNIYHRVGGQWTQVDSHHSLPDGSQNPANIRNDTQTDRVLISDDFAYWGGCGPKIPEQFRDLDGYDLCAKRGHKCQFPLSMETAFVAWFRALDISGFRDKPLDWVRTP